MCSQVHTLISVFSVFLVHPCGITVYGSNDWCVPFSLSLFINIPSPFSDTPLSSSHSAAMRLTVNTSITVREGDPLHILCKARGIPEPTVILHKVIEFNGPSDQGGSTFLVSKAKLEHAGKFLCIATQYSFYVDDYRPTPTSTVALSQISVTVLGKCILHALIRLHVSCHTQSSVLCDTYTGLGCMQRGSQCVNFIVLCTVCLAV